MVYKYYTLDVFTDVTFGGNQLAVFPDASKIPDNQLQKIANEMKLSETTFIYPTEHSDCDYKVRIFTPVQELPMAGHPTLGTAYVLTSFENLSGKDELTMTLEEGVGPIKVDILIENGVPGLITMQQYNPRISAPFEDRDAIAKLLSLRENQLVSDLPIQILDCGVPYMMVPVKDLKSVESIKFRLDVYDDLYQEHRIPFTLAYTLETVHLQNDVHCRMFAPEAGVLEDPATGSAHGPLGGYLAIHEILGAGDIQFVSEQGYELGRPSQLNVAIQKNGDQISKVLVGGRCVPVGEGVLRID